MCIYIYIYIYSNKFPFKYRIGLINSETIIYCQTVLNKETWGCVYIDKDTNHLFNSFLCIFLNIFQVGFPLQYTSMRDKNNWITQGIKISCKHKAASVPSLRTAMIQKQQHIILNVVKS